MGDEKECLFCRLYEEGDEVIWRGQFHWSRFDRFPVSPGHALLIPDRHVVSIKELGIGYDHVFIRDIRKTIEDIEAADLREVYEGILKNPPNDKSREFCERALASPFLRKKPDGYTIGINEGRAAGRTIDHLHVQIIPRFEGDVNNPAGGVRNVIPERGDYR